MLINKEVNEVLRANPITIFYGIYKTQVTYESFTKLNNKVTSELDNWTKIKSDSVMKTEQVSRYSIIKKTLEKLNGNIPKDSVQQIIDELRNNCSRTILFIEFDSSFSHFIVSYEIVNLNICNNVYNYLKNDSIDLRYLVGEELRAFMGACSLSFEDHNRNKLQKSTEATKLETLLSDILSKSENKAITVESQIDTILETTKQTIASEIETNKQLFNEAHIKLDSENEQILQTTKEQFKKTKETYEELLRLQAPAKYWNDLKIEYNKKAHVWTRGSIGIAFAIFVITVLIVIFLPDILFSKKEGIGFAQDTAINISTFIRWIVITGLGLSVLIYLLRFFIKMALSAFHMARDAEERYTLTYLYLSLVNEGKFDSSQTPIVFSALFSRVDTGLLKGDSAPTIVGGASQIIELAKGGYK